MKKMNILPALLAVLALSMGCSKGSGPEPEPTSAIKYLTTTANSTWNYRLVNSAGPVPVVTDYTLKATNRDSVANSKTYRVYTNLTTNGSEYQAIVGNDYYTFLSIAPGLGLSSYEALILKDNVAQGATWTQLATFNVGGVSVPVTITYTLAGKGLSKTVNGNAYSDVLRVVTTLQISPTVGIPASALTTDLEAFYAPKVGLIERKTVLNFSFSGFTQATNQLQTLLSADLK